MFQARVLVSRECSCCSNREKTSCHTHVPGSIAVDGGKAASAVPPRGAAWVTTWCPIWDLVVSETAVKHCPTTFFSYSSP